MNSTCPLCQKTSQHLWRPFCSQRCQQIDLGRWLSGTYCVPSEETEGSSLNIDDELL